MKECLIMWDRTYTFRSLLARWMVKLESLNIEPIVRARSMLCANHMFHGGILFIECPDGVPETHEDFHRLLCEQCRAKPKVPYFDLRSYKQALFTRVLSPVASRENLPIRLSFAPLMVWMQLLECYKVAQSEGAAE